jgi:hypothetical protein
MRRLACFTLLALWLCQLAGCTLLHELQPHRLRQWNRGPAPSMDADFTTMTFEPAAPALASVGPSPMLTVRAQQ